MYNMDGVTIIFGVIALTVGIVVLVAFKTDYKNTSKL